MQPFTVVHSIDDVVCIKFVWAISAALIDRSYCGNILFICRGHQEDLRKELYDFKCKEQ